MVILFPLALIVFTLRGLYKRKHFRTILFSEEADGNYLQVGRVDTSIIVKGMDVTKATLTCASDVDNTLIFDALTKKCDTTKSYNLNEIENYDYIQRRQLALYNATTFTDGLYRTYEEFASQTPSGGQDEFLKRLFIQIIFIYLPTIFYF
ncbi:MAG: hypothetical protein ACN6ON_02425 [Sphingobacterium sp.]